MKQYSWTLKYKQNDLFRPGESFHLNACVGRNGGPYSFGAYSRGYFDAGDRLVQSIFDNHRYVDIIVYPLVFIYRHAVELGLKDLASRVPPLLGETQTIQLTHRLLDNWRIVRGYLERCDGGLNDPDPIQLVEKVLADFVQLDPKGETFRFPEDTHGNPHLQDTSIINVEVFASAMEKVHEAFEFWFDVTSILWNDLSDSQSSYPNEASLYPDEMLWDGPRDLGSG